MKKAFRGFIAILALATSVTGLPARPAQAALPAVPSGYEMVDLIANNGFEDAAAALGFAPNDSVASDGNPVRTTTNPISGTGSLRLDPLRAYGHIIHHKDYPYGAGPLADSVTFAASVRVDSASVAGAKLQVCAIAYLQSTNVPLSACQDYPVNPSSIADVFLTVDTNGQQLDYVFPQFKLDNSGEIVATVDDAHFYVVQPASGTTTPPPASCTSDTWTCTNWSACSASGTQARTCTLTSDCAGVSTPSPAASQSCTAPAPEPAPTEPSNSGGEYPSSANGRYVAMMAPTNGETFWAPTTSLRLVAQGFDPNVYTNQPSEGRGQNAAEVKFYVDSTPVLTVSGANAEYSVFKGFVHGLTLSPGQHYVWARATYVNPSLVLDSQRIAIIVQNPPAYAQTVNLTQDVVLSSSNPSYQLSGTESARIRLNGNGFKIRGVGNLSLRYVDVYDLGSRSATGSAGVEVTSTGSVVIEHSTFDNANQVWLKLDNAATASIRGNTFRSNNRNPIGQQPYPPDTYRAFHFTGTSTAAKTFAGNNIAAGPVGLYRASYWTLGGPTNADSNILIGPRAAFEIQESSNVTVRGNFVRNAYYGGWSQGQLMELPGSRGLVIEHNVLTGSSWPVRGLANSAFAYNLVTNGGHTWLSPGENAHVHHNIFVHCDGDGGDCDWGGIGGLYDVDGIRLENNTFDARSQGILRAAVSMQNGSATLKSNSFVNVPSSTSGAVVEIASGAAVSADYNAFYNQQPKSYSDNRAPAHDVKTNPLFAGPMPGSALEADQAAVWKRQLSVGSVLANYRARYTPAQGSPLIDAGDPAGGTGNDIGAVGAGAANALDKFGSFGQSGWTPPPTPANQTPAPSCTADTWTCTNWSACSASGTQARTCTLTSDCAGVSTPSPATSQSCTAAPASSTLAPGSLVKRADQAAVYYYASNGRRYVFPNEATFKTWYRIPEAFATVRTISASELASIPLGENNVTYRGGFKLGKITTDPKVYAIAHGGVLRHVTSEALAAALYGTNWAKLVDDIPDTFFINYTVGAPITSVSEYDRAAELAAAISVNGDKGLGDLPTATPLPTPPASCTADTWTCTNWSACSASGTQARTCALTSDCAGVSTPSPATSQSCAVPPTGGSGTYPGYTYNLPTTRPFISLQDFQASVGTATYTRFKQHVDAALAGNKPYAYTPSDAVVLYALSGEAKYIDHAIAEVEALVAAAEADIAAGRAPDISGDSYLDAGWHLEQVALTYDRGYAKLTASQRARWSAFAEQALYNIWNPQSAKWGSKTYPWSGWSINNPGNNYFYSFMQATQMWALASQNPAWFSHLQTRKFPQIVEYYGKIPGGGSREGTGYGTAQRRLFENYRMWKASTGEDLGKLSSHAKDTAEYWVHATVPTLNRFAPIGDQSRSSQPELYDYHENLVREAVIQAQGTEAARHGLWWLNNNSVQQLANSFNLRGGLLTPVDSALAPSALSYHSAGTGDFFARSSWSADALWLAIKTGPYDESHAHNDQGSFTLYRNDWLSVTSNIWSHSGLQGANYGDYLGTEAHNVLRFTKSGAVLPQNFSVSSMTQSSQNGVITVNADLTPAYSSNAGSVQSWKRQFVFNPTAKTLRVTDACQVATGVSAVFQVHVPVQPVKQADGSIKAGHLAIRPASGLSAQFVSMTSVDSDFKSGWRIDITNPNGCSYDVELAAL